MKRVLKIIAIGLVIGTLLFIVNKAFNIPKDVFMNFLMICFVVVVFGSAISYVFYNYRCEKKIKASVKLLENGKAKEYIEALEVLLKNIKGSYMKNYITVSLSAGYCDLNDYEKAIELLESLTNVPLHGDLKIVQRMNLCSCYFYTHQGEKAMELYQNS
ncbi:MAG: hypothetical protein PHY44_03515 [Lachnospiraceae bacterium]|nr:hypothetical protein [Lachnospiraceae bacterium]